MKKFLVLVILASIPLILPFFHRGYFPTHDGEWAIVRIADIGRSLRDGQFPVRFSGYLNHQYGYPLFNFAYPLPSYLGLLVKQFHIGLVDSLKLLFAISVPLSAIFMFLTARKLWNNDFAGLVSSLFYVYLPYRIVDLYARGSVGESLAFILFPLLFWLVLRNSFLVAIFFAALVLTHNIMALLFAPILVCLAIAVKSKQSLVYMLFGLGLSAFFWLPAILEKQNIILSIVPIANRALYFVKPLQLLLPQWGYGLPTDPSGGFSYQIGWPHALAFILVGIMAVKSKKYFPGLLFFLGLGMILMMFSFTAIVWQVTPLLKEINYPWTLLAPLGFVVSLLAGYLGSIKRGKIVGLILVIFAIILVLPNAKPAYYFDKGDNFYTTNDGTTTSSDELMPVWVKIKPTESPSKKVEVVSGTGEITNIVSKSNSLSFEANLNTSTKVLVNTIYYPGWSFSANGQNFPITYSNPKGLMTLNLPAGDFNVIGKIKDTPDRTASNLISLVSIFLFLGYAKIKKFS